MALLNNELMLVPSLPFRPVTRTIGHALLIVVTLSVFTTGYAILTLALSIKDAEAVNVAGSMRMQSYRIAFDIQSDSPDFELHLRQFEYSLFSDSMKNLNHWMVPADIKKDYQNIAIRWAQLIELLESEDKTNYLTLVSDFVSRIDSFVYKLQQYSEKKIKNLALVGGIGLSAIFIVALFVVRFVRSNIVNPLSQLVVASEQIQHRNFNIKLNVKGNNELSILAATFSDMSKELFAMYDDLEQAVANKTYQLHSANQSLNVLYRSSSLLTDNNISFQTFEGIVHEVLNVEGVSAVKLTIDEEPGIPAEIKLGANVFSYTFSKSINYSDKVLGKLEWETDGVDLDNSLMESIASIFARGIHYQNLQKQNEQWLISTERTAIARELHDSLAQSLSYLKIQMTLLKRQLVKEMGGENAALKSQTIIEDIDSGLKTSYTQLRELLSTFRLTIKEANFGEALKAMLLPLSTQSESIINIDNRLSSLGLSAPQQVHLLQIIREAVLNAIKHAQSSSIEISCWHVGEQVYVLIQDDGKGFDKHAQFINHYGLTIMKERARHLNAQFEIKTNIGEGCRVSLSFEQHSKGSK